ncbi:putative RING finger protein P32A8.03c [Psilocybe cubensis]|uniref:RING finger protein P32A8.03c n=1 Tax=Psilocybe cubensis TaxID=181762 RepID=A0ACB8HEK9_PSICU|nr:putative RING finger protein P32A8.03c [Psilocybe cubensis]KAH9486238.1 putative RING finger protein P32A8.03c [Psilocybe cubensis]
MSAPASREPLWFCHECHAEMRPLMVPDPVCASCHGSFVEKMENEADDPRQFAHDIGGEHLDGPEDGEPGPMPLEGLFFALQAMMDRGIPRNGSPRPSGAAPAVAFEMRGPGGRTVRIGGTNILGGPHNGVPSSRPDSPNAIPNMSTFLGGSNPHAFGGAGGRDISGPLMAQYLMALLGHHELHMPGGIPENGRMGDYVFNQEALDNIITQIMENSNSHRPVPATEEIIQKLPREVLEEGSATLEHDCAVCKEQFKLESEDPDEQIVVTLPSQPEQHPPPPRNPGANTSGGSGSRPQSPGSNASNQRDSGSGPGREQGGGGIFQSIFSGLSGLAHHNNSNQDSHSTPSTGNRSGARSPPRSNTQARPESPSHSPHRRSNSDPFSRSRNSPSSNSNSRSSGGQGQSRGNPNVPGSWSEDLD